MSLPQNAIDFSRLWRASDQALIHGDQHIPDKYRRQDRLIGMVLNACLVLHVYEEIKRGQSFTNLRSFFTDGFKKEDFEELKKLPENERLEKLTSLIQERGKKPRLKSHRDLIVDNKWNKYKKDYGNYLEDMKAWNYEVMRICQTDCVSEGVAAVIPPRPKMPQDPRIQAVNDDISVTVEIYNSGCKPDDSIQRKSELKGGIKALRDINRLKILPTSVAAEEDFIKIIALMNPPKLLDKKADYKIKTPRFFAEPPEIRDNGFYNQKLLVAMDEGNERNTVTPTNKGAIAEIQLVPKEMGIAEKLSAPLNEITRLLDELGKYARKNKDGEPIPATYEMLANRAQLHSTYIKQITRFQKLAEQFNKDYHLPLYPSENLDSPQTYADFKKSLSAIATQIHTDAVVEAEKDRQIKYLKTGIIQQMAKDEGVAQQITNKLCKELPRTDFNNRLLSIIAQAAHLNLKAIRDEVASELDLTIPTKTK